ncbi:hypothetical protein ASG73_10295 [Janibacter sp. Soil728]|nr:hypothetical protein ASG73_10295 [Janibacter sp. Soil728]
MDRQMEALQRIRAEHAHRADALVGASVGGRRIGEAEAGLYPVTVPGKGTTFWRAVEVIRAHGEARLNGLPILRGA